MKKFLTFVTLISAVSVILPRTTGQTSANVASVFHVVATPNGHPTPFQNDLHSVSASSPADLWAVGQTAIHFDGSKWSAFSMPKIHGDNTSRLGGVVDLAPNNVWAVGRINIGLGNGNQVIEHFDGTKWSISPGPTFQPTDQHSLESITAISASDIWAAGFILTNNGQSLFPLFEHFDGTSWTAFETLSQNATMFGISAHATNDAWAVGTVAFSQTAIEHFDGSSWSTVPSPNAGLGFNVLTGVTALAPNDVWAAGYFTRDVNSTRPAKTLIEHWDGTKWSIVPSPNPVTGDFRADILFGGTVIPQGNLWIVGNEFGRTLAINATGQ